MGQLSEAVKDALVFYAKYKIAQTIAWAAENPARAMLYTAGGTAAMTNPTARAIVLKVVGHVAKQAARDAAFYGRLALTDVIAPVARNTARAAARGAGAAARATGRLAVGAATNPAVAIPVVAVGAATAGGVASAAITSGINRQHNVPSSSPVSMWSPFGGMQLGTVV